MDVPAHRRRRARTRVSARSVARRGDRRRAGDDGRQTVFATGEPFSFFVEAAERLFAGKLDDEIETELRAIAEGATAAGTPVSYGEILTWNAYLELLWNWWPNRKGTSRAARGGVTTVARSSQPVAGPRTAAW
jgi:hypothetical protein